MFLYADCPSGISGDMFLAALVDAGAPIGEIRAAIASLKIGPVGLTLKTVRKGAIAGQHLTVSFKPGSVERDWASIRELIHGSKKIPKRAKERALAVFEALAKAEAKIHGVPADHVHFHEVGAVDSIVDVVGACVALESLGVDELACSPLPLGTGFVKCRHGVIPLPAPATVELLKGMKSYGAGVEGETVTPTGAALMKALATSCGPIPEMQIESIGYGAGTKNFPDRPNVVRVFVGKKIGEARGDKAIVIEANVDDMIPQDFEPMTAALFDAGALDVSLVPIHMKKNRPGILVVALAATDKAAPVSDALIKHSTTIGLRSYTVDRAVMKRSESVVNTAFGAIRCKISELPGGGKRVTPEYDDLRKLASSKGATMEEVRRAFHSSPDFQKKTRSKKS